MATNIIVARGGVEYVPPLSLAFWRWLTVFLILLPFFYSEILSNKKFINKTLNDLKNVKLIPKRLKFKIMDTCDDLKVSC